MRGTLPEEDGKYDNFSWEAKPHLLPGPFPLAMLKQDRGDAKEIVDEKVGTWLDGVPVPEEIGEVTVEAPTNNNADEETAAETLADDNAEQLQHLYVK